MCRSTAVTSSDSEKALRERMELAILCSEVAVLFPLVKTAPSVASVLGSNPTVMVSPDVRDDVVDRASAAMALISPLEPAPPAPLGASLER